MVRHKHRPLGRLGRVCVFDRDEWGAQDAEDAMGKIQGDARYGLLTREHERQGENKQGDMCEQETRHYPDCSDHLQPCRVPFLARSLARMAPKVRFAAQQWISLASGSGTGVDSYACVRFQTPMSAADKWVYLAWMDGRFACVAIHCV